MKETQQYLLKERLFQGSETRKVGLIGLFTANIYKTNVHRSEFFLLNHRSHCAINRIYSRITLNIVMQICFRIRKFNERS